MDIFQNLAVDLDTEGKLGIQAIIFSSIFGNTFLLKVCFQFAYGRFCYLAGMEKVRSRTAVKITDIFYTTNHQYRQLFHIR